MIDVASETCGAKLRDGSFCPAFVVDGAARCFKHGGAPRSGAPKGNSNALKHGARADGDARKPRRRRSDEAGMRELAQWALFRPREAMAASASEEQGGQVLAETLREVATDLNRRLRQGQRLGRTTYSAFLAQRDVLERLLAAPSCFVSTLAFRCRVACTFMARFEARAKLSAATSVDVLGYSEAWANLCVELIWADWPANDGEPKPR
jgi:hypothetical protein